MTQLLTEIVGGEPYEYLPLGEHVVRAPGVCGGRPTFKYTRIEVTGTSSVSLLVRRWKKSLRATMVESRQKL